MTMFCATSSPFRFVILLLWFVVSVSKCWKRPDELKSHHMCLESNDPKVRWAMLSNSIDSLLSSWLLDCVLCPREIGLLIACGLRAMGMLDMTGFNPLCARKACFTPQNHVGDIQVVLRWRRLRSRCARLAPFLQSSPPSPFEKSVSLHKSAQMAALKLHLETALPQDACPTVHLIRHGQSQGQAALDRHIRQTDPSLTDCRSTWTGQEQARNIRSLFSQAEHGKEASVECLH